jgi:fluoroacetyl-CoA thioesterase
MSKPVPLGARGEAQQHVAPEHTLTYWNPELPPVYSTPHMIGLMETAAYQALKAYCEPGEISVGTAIHIDHRASATVGATVKAEAELESFDGRFFVFRVSAKAVSGDGEVEIGRGTVSRAIVHGDRLRKKFQK